MAVGTRRGGLAAKLVLCCSALMAVGLLSAGPAAAAPPANDNFASAQTITGTNVNVAGTNFQATKQTGEPNHDFETGGASVWYSWTAPSTAAVKLDTCDANFYSVLAVYTGSAVNGLTRVASNSFSATCDQGSSLAFHAVSGTTYKIAVDGNTFGGGEPADTGNFDLILKLATTPANDNFAAAQVILSQAENAIEGSNAAATKQAGEPDHALSEPGGASVWYSWVAPVTGTFQIDVCSADFHALLAVYTGNALNSLTQIAAPGICFLSFHATQGTTYRIAVDGHTESGQPVEIGGFILYTHLTAPPPNDDFAYAQTVSGANIHVTGDNFDATWEPGEPSGFAAGPIYSVWYSWTAPVSGQATIDACASDFDTVLTVFTGSSLGTLSRVASNDDASNCGFGGSKLILNVNGGTTYKIAIDGYYEQGDIDLKLALNPGLTIAQKDSKAPNSKIKKVVVDSEHHKAKITFGSSEAGSSYKCKLDKAKYKSCHSPKTFRHLDEGKHKVKVLATDAAGNTDPTAAVKKFKIDG